MSHDAAELLKLALTLPEQERAELENSLLESLGGPPDDPKAIETEWNEEIARRIEALDSGKGGTVPWEAVRLRISSKLNHGT